MRRSSLLLIAFVLAFAAAPVAQVLPIQRIQLLPSTSRPAVWYEKVYENLDAFGNPAFGAVPTYIIMHKDGKRYVYGGSGIDSFGNVAFGAKPLQVITE
jgi:hypothetical protein